MSTDVAGADRGYDDESALGDGHGTNVAQVLLGARNDRGTMGIAFDATLLGLRADRPGSCGNTSGPVDEQGCLFDDLAIATGVERAIGANARVLNISLGGSTPEPVLRDAITRAAAAGMVIIVSAGNDGDSTDPDIDPNNPDPFAQGLQQAGNGLVIIAGSTDAERNLSDFSNRAGSYAQSYLSALGGSVCCEYRNGNIYRETRPDGTFVFLLNGTSFAAPQIAGAAALLAQAFPNLTGRDIVSLLLRTADDVGDPGPDAIFGRGVLNIRNAFAPQAGTSIASTAVPLPLDSSVGTLSPAMGMGARSGAAPTIILDGYGRAYQLDVGRMLATGADNPLLRRAIALSGARTSMRFGRIRGDAQLVPNRVVGGVPSTWLGNNGLPIGQGWRLSSSRMAVALQPGTTIAFGIRSGASQLLTAPDARDSGAFLTGDTSAAQAMIGLWPQWSAGFAQRIGGLMLSTSAEWGEVGHSSDRRLAILDGQHAVEERSYRSISAALAGRRGDVAGSLMLRLTDERATILGASFNQALVGGGARSAAFDVRLQWMPAQDWQLRGWWSEGLTRPDGGGLASGGRLRTRAWAFDVGRTNWLLAGDWWGVRFSQPLRVESGGIDLNLPQSYDYGTGLAQFGNVPLDLSPDGRERMIEAGWSAPLSPGQLSANLFWRAQPGHRLSAPDDQGAVVRYHLGF